MIRLSATSLDKFAAYQRGGETYPGSGKLMTEELLIEAITTFTKGYHASVGDGFHLIAEYTTKVMAGRNPGSNEKIWNDEIYYYYHCEGVNHTWKYRRHCLESALFDLRLYHSNSEWETKREKIFEFDGNRKVCMVNKADIVGLDRIADIKTKSSKVDLDAFRNSWQWKSYLDTFGLDVFEYWIFPLWLGNFDISTEICTEPLTCLRYPGMAEELRKHIEDFAYWAYNVPKVLEYLTQRQLLYGTPHSG